jgi:hypothetical protein
MAVLNLLGALNHHFLMVQLVPCMEIKITILYPFLNLLGALNHHFLMVQLVPCMEIKITILSTTFGSTSWPSIRSSNCWSSSFRS